MILVKAFTLDQVVMRIHVGFTPLFVKSTRTRYFNISVLLKGQTWNNLETSFETSGFVNYLPNLMMQVIWFFHRSQRGCAKISNTFSKVVLFNWSSANRIIKFQLIPPTPNLEMIRFQVIRVNIRDNHKESEDFRCAPSIYPTSCYLFITFLRFTSFLGGVIDVIKSTLCY